jgi:hypothetical protein
VRGPHPVATAHRRGRRLDSEWLRLRRQSSSSLLVRTEAVSQTNGIGAKQQRLGEPPETDALGGLLRASAGSGRLICLRADRCSWRSITNNPVRHLCETASTTFTSLAIARAWARRALRISSVAGGNSRRVFARSSDLRRQVFVTAASARDIATAAGRCCSAACRIRSSGWHQAHRVRGSTARGRPCARSAHTRTRRGPEARVARKAAQASPRHYGSGGQVRAIGSDAGNGCTAVQLENDHDIVARVVVNRPGRAYRAGSTAFRVRSSAPPSAWRVRRQGTRPPGRGLVRRRGHSCHRSTGHVSHPLWESICTD